MKVERYGIILNTENYEECVRFYREVFDLKLMFQLDDQDSRLTCLELGETYLMIEGEGVAGTGEKSVTQCPSKLRFNVEDIEAARDRLKEFGIAAEVNRFNWGATINICDPDGNRIGIRDEPGFRKQMPD